MSIRTTLVDSEVTIRRVVLSSGINVLAKVDSSRLVLMIIPQNGISLTIGVSSMDASPIVIGAFEGIQINATSQCCLLKMTLGNDGPLVQMEWLARGTSGDVVLIYEVTVSPGKGEC